MMNRGHCGLALLGLLLALPMGCSDTTKPDVAPIGSTLRVTAATSGDDPDGDGYTVRIDGGSPYALTSNGSVVLPEPPPGTHDVRLEGVATNCAVTEGALRSIVVVTGQPIVVAFSITCLPRTGIIRITTVTSGADAPVGSYSGALEHSARTIFFSLPLNGSVDIPAGDGGDYVIGLSGVPANCAVSGVPGFWGSEWEISMNRGVSATVNFVVTCASVSTARLASDTQLAFERAGQIYRVNADGSGLARLTDGPRDLEPTWSPDGRRIAFSRERDNARNIYIMNADGSNVVRLTNSSYNETPAWSPDGSRIAFASLGLGSLNIHSLSVDDIAATAVVVVQRPGWNSQPAWSPDGSRIAFSSDWVLYDSASDIFAVSPLGGSQVTQLTNGAALSTQHYQPAWSPDGRQLAMVMCRYTYETCDASVVALMSADGSGVRRLVSTRGFAHPTWSHDGRTVAFSSDGRIQWMNVLDGTTGLIVADGNSPSWKP